ncbi:MAG: WD40 repeat domain-containing protein, partial [Gemmata sp.]
MIRRASGGLLSMLLVAGAAAQQPAPPGGPLTPQNGGARAVWPVLTQQGPPKLDRHGDPLPAGAVARYGTVRLRHGADVAAMAFTADAKLLCTVSATDDSVKLWDTATGKAVAKLDAVALLIAPANDGSVVLIEDAKCRVWIPGTGATRDLPQKALPEGADPTALAVSPDSKSFAVAAGGKVHLIDLQTGKAVRELNVPAAPGGNNGARPAPPQPAEGPVLRPTKLAYSPDGKWLAGSGQNTGVWLWELRTGRRVRTYHAAGSTPDFAFSPDVTRLLVAGDRLCLYPLDAEEEVDGFKGPENLPVLAVRFSADGKLIRALQPDGSVLPLDAATGDERDPVEPPDMNLRPPGALAPGGTMAAAVDQTGGIRVWDARTGKGPDVQRLPALLDATFGADGKTVTALDQTNRLHTFDPGTGAAGKVLDLELGDDTLPTVWDARSRRLAAVVPAGDDLEVHFIDADTKKVVSKHSVPASGGLPTTSFAAANRDRAAVFSQFTVQVVNPTTGRGTRAIGTNQDEMQVRGGISPDGRVVAVITRNVTVYEAATGKKRFAFDALNPDTVAFSPDSRLLAVCDNTGVSVYDLRSGARARRIATAETGESLSAAAFSPDGKRFAGGFYTGRVTVWDVASGDTLAPFPGHDGAVASAAFSADGKRLVTAANDGTALVWAVPDKPQPVGPATT